MKVSYFPGCTLKNKAKELDTYAYRVAEALGVTMEEIEEWQCCGGVFTTARNEVATKLSSVRALKYASDRNRPLVSVCSACHNVLKQTNHAMQNDKEFADKVSEGVEKILLPYVRKDLMSNFIHWDMLMFLQRTGTMFYYGWDKALAQPEDYSKSAAGLYIII